MTDQGRVSGLGCRARGQDKRLDLSCYNTARGQLTAHRGFSSRYRPSPAPRFRWTQICDKEYPYVQH